MNCHPEIQFFLISLVLEQFSGFWFIYLLTLSIRGGVSHWLGRDSEANNLFLPSQYLPLSLGLLLLLFFDVEDEVDIIFVAWKFIQWSFYVGTSLHVLCTVLRIQKLIQTIEEETTTMTSFFDYKTLDQNYRDYCKFTKNMLMQFWWYFETSKIRIFQGKYHTQDINFYVMHEIHVFLTRPLKFS